MPLPFEVKATVPVGPNGPFPAIEAVNVTGCPNVDGLRLELRVVVVDPGVTVCDKVALLPV
jgi:hypothetical protein